MSSKSGDFRRKKRISSPLFQGVFSIFLQKRAGQKPPHRALFHPPAQGCNGRQGRNRSQQVLPAAEPCSPALGGAAFLPKARCPALKTAPPPKKKRKPPTLHDAQGGGFLLRPTGEAQQTWQEPPPDSEGRLTSFSIITMIPRVTTPSESEGR